MVGGVVFWRELLENLFWGFVIFILLGSRGVVFVFFILGRRGF